MAAEPNCQPSYKEKIYRAYLEFMEVAERQRRWNIFDDIPWDALDRSMNSEQKAVRVETFCAEELYVPDYTACGLVLTRDIFGLAWFAANWGYEESRHGLAFREYLLRSGMRTPAQMEALENTLVSKTWQLPFMTRRQMACYGALQEAATYLAYKAQRDRARDEKDRTLETIFFLVGRDEAAHAGFYRRIVGFEMDEDRAGTIADLAHVLGGFEMPGAGLIPEYKERLRDAGGGISPRRFMERGLLPILRALDIGRDEFKQAQSEESAAVAAVA